jgi:uncharacterized membrane protein YoaK (UPF0700 family)
MVLHRQDTLTRRKHLTSWALLAFSAGAVNAGALLACQRFVSHVTGTVTRIGVDVHETLALDYLLVLVAFIAGAASAILIARAVRRSPSAAPGYWAPLLLVALLLGAVAVLGHRNAFDAFGGSVETPRDFALLAILSLAMGMQSAAVAASTGLSVRTTHMTGPATDIGIALAQLSSADDVERLTARSSLMLRCTKLLSFIVGGATMAVLCSRLEFLAFACPAATILAATALSYVPREWMRPSSRRGACSSTLRRQA